MLYSPDGKEYFSLAIEDFGGTNLDHTVCIENPHHQFSAKVTMNDGTVAHFLGKVFRRQTMPFNPNLFKVRPLPNVRVTRYFFESKSGLLLYVSDRKYAPQVESLRFFLGTEKEMRELAIEQFKCHQDGGSTFIKTCEGVFYSPTPSGNPVNPSWGRVAKWNETPLNEANPRDYTFDESASGLILVKKT